MLLVGSQRGCQVDGDGCATNSTRSARDRDDLRSVILRLLRIEAATQDPVDRFKKLDGLGRQCEELAGTGADRPENQRVSLVRLAGRITAFGSAFDIARMSSIAWLVS